MQSSHKLNLGRIHTKHLKDGREVGKSFEHDIQLLKAIENPEKAFQSAKQAPDFIAYYYGFSVLFNKCL